MRGRRSCGHEETIEPGKEKDGYWTNRNLVNQFKAGWPCIKVKFDAICDEGKWEAIMQVNNSGNHNAMAPDALIAAHLNKSDGFPAQRASEIAAGEPNTGFRDTLAECHAVLAAQPDFAAQTGKTWLHEECAKLRDARVQPRNQ